MTPDEALEQLAAWAKDSRRRNLKARARKLEGFAQVIERLQQDVAAGATVASDSDLKADLRFLGKYPPLTPPYEAQETSGDEQNSPTWRDKAREFGIPMYQRKRADVEADIAKAEEAIRVVEANRI